MGQAGSYKPFLNRNSRQSGPNQQHFETNNSKKMQTLDQNEKTDEFPGRLMAKQNNRLTALKKA